MIVNTRWILAVTVGALLGAFSYARLPYALTHANWVFNVSRNWQEYGYAALRGELVANAGGRDAREQPVVYPGHSRRFMVTTRPAVWVMGDVHRGLLLHNALLAALTVAAAWRALGPRWGTWTGWAWALSPGVTRLLVPEPIGTPMQWGGPLALWLLAEARARPPVRFRLAGCLLLILLWTQLNWTTAFLLGPLMLALLAAAPAPQRGRWFGLCLLLGAALLPVGATTLLSKVGPQLEAGSSWRDFLLNYGFGAGGYGRNNPVTWTTALIRLGAAAAVGMAPLLAIFAARLIVQVRARTLGIPLILPPTGALLLVLLFRNYFAHHPWMACPVLAAGLLLGLGAADSPPPSATGRFVLPFAFVLILGLGWNALVMQLFEVQTASLGSLARLVQHATPRPATLWFAADLTADPHFRDLDEASMDLDRPVTAWTNALVGPREGFLLTRQPDPQRADQLVASTSGAPEPTLLARALTWYRLHLGRRRAGDSLEPDQPLYLYRLP